MVQDAFAYGCEGRCSIEPEEYVGIVGVHGLVILPWHSWNARCAAAGLQPLFVASQRLVEALDLQHEVQFRQAVGRLNRFCEVMSQCPSRVCARRRRDGS